VPVGTFQSQIASIAPVLLRPPPLAAVFGVLKGFEKERNQAVRVALGAQDYMTAATAIAAIGTALGDIFFAAEKLTAPLAAVSGGYMEHGRVDEAADFHAWGATDSSIRTRRPSFS